MFILKQEIIIHFWGTSVQKMKYNIKVRYE